MDNTNQRPEFTGSDDTGTFGYIDHSARIASSGQQEPVVYGLGVNKHDAETAAARRKNVKLIVGGVLGATALIGTLLAIQVVPTFLNKDNGSSAQTQASVTNKTPKDNDVAEDSTTDDAQPLEILTIEGLHEFLHSVTFDGQDVSLVEGDDAVLDAAEGHLTVSHIIVDNADILPWTLADFEAQRAAALASSLDGIYVQGEDEEDPYQLKDVTWVANNEEGNALLAITFAAGEAPTSGDTAQVLASAKGYAISDGFYYALGRDSIGYPQHSGQTPTDVHGNEIELTGYLPRFGTGE